MCQAFYRILRSIKTRSTQGRLFYTQGPFFCALAPLFCALVREEAIFAACKRCAKEGFACVCKEKVIKLRQLTLLLCCIRQNCLGIIYTVYVENSGIPLETLVGNILGCIQVPPPGGPQVRFSIGAGDRQALQPPISPALPITHTSVNLLFQQLGTLRKTSKRVIVKSKSLNIVLFSSFFQVFETL